MQTISQSLTGILLIYADLSPRYPCVERCKIVEEALDIAIGIIKPGIYAREVDKKARTYFMKKGYDGAFIHHTGHPVGNSWGIMLTPNSPSVIKEGMAFALEPGIYDERGGVRIEDNVCVIKNGAVNIMNLPRVLQFKEEQKLKNLTNITAKKGKA